MSSAKDLPVEDPFIQLQDLTYHAKWGKTTGKDMKSNSRRNQEGSVMAGSFCKKESAEGWGWPGEQWGWTWRVHTRGAGVLPAWWPSRKPRSQHGTRFVLISKHLFPDLRHRSAFESRWCLPTQDSQHGQAPGWVPAPYRIMQCPKLEGGHKNQ